MLDIKGARLGMTATGLGYFLGYIINPFLPNEGLCQRKVLLGTTYTSYGYPALLGLYFLYKGDPKIASSILAGSLATNLLFKQAYQFTHQLPLEPSTVAFVTISFLTLTFYRDIHSYVNQQRQTANPTRLHAARRPTDTTVPTPDVNINGVPAPGPQAS